MNKIFILIISLLLTACSTQPTFTKLDTADQETPETYRGSTDNESFLITVSSDPSANNCYFSEKQTTPSFHTISLCLRRNNQDLKGNIYGDLFLSYQDKDTFSDGHSSISVPNYTQLWQKFTANLNIGDKFVLKNTKTGETLLILLRVN